MRQFDYYPSARSNKPQLLTPAILDTMLGSSSSYALIEQIRGCEDKKERSRLKTNLPAVNWSAHCDEKRAIANAHPSGLAMLDIDDVKNPVELRAQLTVEMLTENHICFAHFTPSLGIRLVGDMELAGCRTIVEWQQKMIEAFNLRPLMDSGEIKIDSVCKDITRLSFIVTEHDVIFRDDELMFRDPGIEYVRTIRSDDNDNDNDNFFAAGYGGRKSLDTSRYPEFSSGSPENHSSKPQEILDQVQDDGKAQADVEAQADVTNDQRPKTNDQRPTTSDHSPKTHDQRPKTNDPRSGEAVDTPIGTTLEDQNQSRCDQAESFLTPDRIEEAMAFRFNGRSLTEIAAAWLQQIGYPEKGRGYDAYKKLVTRFRHLCDYNFDVLFCQLPDLRQEAKKRKGLIDFAIKNNTSMPRDFELWLIDKGFMAKEKSYDEQRIEQVYADMNAKAEARIKAKQEAEDVIEVEDDVTKADLGRWPSVYNIYKRICPLHLAKTMPFMLDAVIGLYASNFTAKYLSGKMEMPCFHNVVVGPPSCGKGAIMDLLEELLEPISAIDEMALAEEQEYFKAERKCKNKAEQPERPTACVRRMENNFSMTALLDRQANARGLLQLIAVTEFDSMWYRKPELDQVLRCAHHGDLFMQRYMSSNSFNGKVRIRLNVFATGTADQFWKYYGNPRNGLCDRINVYNITERYVEDWLVKEMKPQEKAYIAKVQQFCLEHTYEYDEEGNIVGIKPKTDITKELAFIKPVIQQFLQEQRLLAAQTNDDARFEFLPRVALDMFRGAICDYVCALGKLTPERKAVISEFRLRKAKEQIELKLAIYRDKISSSKLMGGNKPRYFNLYEEMPDEFYRKDLEEMRMKYDVLSDNATILKTWKDTGLIETSTRRITHTTVIKKVNPKTAKNETK